MIKMKKKGDIPVSLLVVGVFAICGLAILSFFISAETQKINFSIINSIEQINFDKERFEFYAHLGFSQDEINNFMNSPSSASMVEYPLFENNLVQFEFISGDPYLKLEKKDKEKIVFLIKYYPK